MVVNATDVKNCQAANNMELGSEMSKKIICEC